MVEAKGGHGSTGPIVGVTTCGPAPLDPRGRNPGLFPYGIHPVKMLFTLMGPGCERPTCLKQPGGEVVIGQWSSGRVVSMRGIRQGRSACGFTVFGEKAVETKGVGTQFIYRELLNQIVTMFETREAPVDPGETLEIVAFMEATLHSAESGGAPVVVEF